MMIYGILITIITILVAAIIFLTFLIKKEKNLNKVMTKEIIETKTTPILIGVITKYTEDELQLLFSNPEILDLLLKIFEYKIAIKTDTIRSLDDTGRKVGHLDCLHEMHLFFHKMRQKLKKKEKKVGKSLI